MHNIITRRVLKGTQAALRNARTAVEQSNAAKREKQALVGECVGHFDVPFLCYRNIYHAAIKQTASGGRATIRTAGARDVDWDILHSNAQPCAKTICVRSKES